MTKKYEKVITLIANISGILIPISLASIIFIGAGSVIGAAKTALGITITFQTLGLILSLWLSINILAKEQTQTALKKDLSYLKGFFFTSLILIFVSHFIVLLSTSGAT